MFYKSKKFAYAVVMLLASLALALLPAAFDLDAEQTQTLNKMVPFVLGLAFALIGGHTLMDALSMAKGVQVPSIEDAVSNLALTIEGINEENPVDVGEILREELKKWGPGNS